MAKKKAAPASKAKKAAPAKGRPSKYNATWAPKMAHIMAVAGMIDKDMAVAMGVHKSTFDKWKNDHPEFKKALKKGKIGPNKRVEAALLLRALGYFHPDVHISNYRGDITITDIVKHYPPDTMACMYWLNNRCRDDPGGPVWQQKQEIQIDMADDPLLKFAEAVLGPLAPDAAKE